MMMRISETLGVFAGLRQFTKTAEEERRWLYRSIAAPPFEGQAPIDLMSDSFERQIEVRQWLAGIVCGIAPNEADIEFKPFATHNIIWH